MQKQKELSIKKSKIDHANHNVDEWPDPEASDLLEGVSFFDDNDDEDAATRQEAAVTALLSLEILPQKGIAIEGEWVRIPGRMPLMPFSLLQMLFSVAGFAAGIIHFSALQPNYLLPLAVLQVIYFAHIILYHSSCRAQRTALAAIHSITLSLMHAFVTWAFIDLIRFPIRDKLPNFWLHITLIAFSAVPVLMLAHLLYFGRSTRLLPKSKNKSKNKPPKTPQAKTSKAITEKEIPTQIIKQIDEKTD